MRIEVLEPEFTVCRVTDYSEVDLEGEFVFTGSTDGERISTINVQERERSPGAAVSQLATPTV